jgi:hypothetical protein
LQWNKAFKKYIHGWMKIYFDLAMNFKKTEIVETHYFYIIPKNALGNGWDYAVKKLQLPTPATFFKKLT